MMRMVIRFLLSCIMVYGIWQVCFRVVRKQSWEDAERIAPCMRGVRALFGIGIGVYVEVLNNYLHNTDTAEYFLYTDTAEYFLYTDTAGYFLYTDTADYLLCIVTAISLACMIFAMFSDLAIKHAYRFCWYGVYATCGMCCSGSLLSERGGELGIFFLLQFLWFSRFYGRADCHGFFAGACILFLYGGSLWDYVMQMAYAFGILFVIQIFRRNINRCGNLKEPVAFLPYVAAGLLLRLFCLRGLH